MSNQDIQDRLRREGDNWIERSHAEAAMRQEKLDRHARNVEVAKVVGAAIVGVAVVAAVVWAVQAVSK